MSFLLLQKFNHFSVKTEQKSKLYNSLESRLKIFRSQAQLRFECESDKEAISTTFSS